MRHCPYMHKKKRQHFHARTTVHWQSTPGTGHIPLEILRFCSAIYRRCGHSFSRHRFHWEIHPSKSPVSKIFKKFKNGSFCIAKFGPLKIIFSFFLPIFLACPSWSFWIPKLWSGTQNEDFQRQLKLAITVVNTDQVCQSVLCVS